MSDHTIKGLGIAFDTFISSKDYLQPKDMPLR